MGIKWQSVMLEDVISIGNHTLILLPPSPYQFFHVFDTKKEVIEEMISDEKKSSLVLNSFVSFLFSVQEFTLFQFLFFLIPASRICCTFVLFFFLFLFLLSLFSFFISGFLCASFAFFHISAKVKP